MKNLDTDIYKLMKAITQAEPTKHEYENACRYRFDAKWCVVDIVQEELPNEEYIYHTFVDGSYIKPSDVQDAIWKLIRKKEG